MDFARVWEELAAPLKSPFFRAHSVLLVFFFFGRFFLLGGFVFWGVVFCFGFFGGVVFGGGFFFLGWGFGVVFGG